MEEFLDKLLTFVDKQTDWKENDETTNSQVINHFLSGNDELVRKLIDQICAGNPKPDTESGLRSQNINGSALFNEMGIFAVNTFSDIGSIEHLKKLKNEADEAISEPQNIVEYADCELALHAAVYRAGFTYEQLQKAKFEKLKIVKKRKWKKMYDGTYQHLQPLQN